MIQEEIKSECVKMFSQIEESKKRLNELQSICKHPNTFEGKYSWRVGCIDDAIICSDCKKLVKYKYI